MCYAYFSKILPIINPPIKTRKIDTIDLFLLIEANLGPNENRI